MNDLFRKVVVLTLVLVMVIQFYIGIVHIVSAFRPSNILKSFMVRSSRSSAAGV